MVTPPNPPGLKPWPSGIHPTPAKSVSKNPTRVRSVPTCRRHLAPPTTALPAATGDGRSYPITPLNAIPKVQPPVPQIAGCGAIFCVSSGPRVVTREGEPFAESAFRGPADFTARDGSFGRERLHQLDTVAEGIVDIDPLIVVKGFVIADGDFRRL